MAPSARNTCPDRNWARNASLRVTYYLENSRIGEGLTNRLILQVSLSLDKGGQPPDKACNSEAAMFNADPKAEG